MSCSVYRLAPKSRAAAIRDGSDASHPHTLCGRTKAETYDAIAAALQKFLAKYPVDLAGRMATLNSFLFANFPRMNFCGFYTVKEAGVSLQVGPYQGEVLACGTIAWGKGVCGTVAASGATAVVRDVREVENYIAVSALLPAAVRTMCAHAGSSLTPHPVPSPFHPHRSATRKRCRKLWCPCLAARTTMSPPRRPTRRESSLRCSILMGTRWVRLMRRTRRTWRRCARASYEKSARRARERFAKHIMGQQIYIHCMAGLCLAAAPKYDRHESGIVKVGPV